MFSENSLLLSAADATRELRALAGQAEPITHNQIIPHNGGTTLKEEKVEKAGASDLTPPRVVRKIANGKLRWVGLFIEPTQRFYLSPTEALSLADRLVDAAEDVDNGTYR